MFAREARSDAEVRKALASVVLFTADVAQEEGSLLNQEYRVRGYPTFALLTPEGAPITTWVGYQKTHFLESLSDALADPTTIEEKTARFAARPTVELAVRLAEHHAARSAYAEAVQYYREAQRLNTDPDRDYLFDVFSTISSSVFGRGTDSVFSRSDLVAAADAVFNSPRRSSADVIGVGSTMASLVYPPQSDTALAAAYIEAAVLATAQDAEARASLGGKYLLVDHALYVLKDREQALAHRRAVLTEGWQDDYKQLLIFAAWCHEQRVNLPEAETLAERGVGLARADPEGEPFARYGASIASGIAFALGDSLGAFEHRKASLPAGWREDAEQLNTLAWWCFEHGTALEEAEILARRGVELAAPGDSRARVLDTLGEIRRLRGDVREALELMRAALRENPDDPYHREQLERFEELADRSD